MAKPMRNMGASVRSRLLNLAKQRNQQFQLLLTRYVLERLLYRLSLTKHRDHFVLKGAMLMTNWFADPHRQTRDVDFLGFGNSDPGMMLDVFREICTVEVDDGVDIDMTALRIDQIREGLEYGGLRIKTTAVVGGARVNVVIDIGFGDAIEPGLEEIELSVLLDLPAPCLRAYVRETVIAEKFHAMVMLGRANSRMKDIYDIWILSRTYEFTGDRLAQAIAATFARRQTPIPVEPPDALTSTFAEDAAKRQQWAAFVNDAAAQPGSLAGVLDDLAAFLMPQAGQARMLGAPERDGSRDRPSFHQ